MSAESQGPDPVAAVFGHVNDHVVEVGHLGPVPVVFSGHILMSCIAGGLVLFLFLWLAGRMARRRGLAPTGAVDNLFESFILFIRDDVVMPNMGHHGHDHVHFFLTLFFFILFANLLGMIPGGQTCTGNISITAALAVATFLYGTYQGMKAQGLLHYLRNLAPAGVPGFVMPILYPIEVLGLLIKHGVLAVRLFANMMAGHLVIGVILALPALILQSSVNAVSLPAFAMAAGISLLELFVAFLQAYVFTMLGSLFVGAAVHPEH